MNVLLAIVIRTKASPDYSYLTKAQRPIPATSSIANDYDSNVRPVFMAKFFQRRKIRTVIPMKARTYESFVQLHEAQSDMMK